MGENKNESNNNSNNQQNVHYDSDVELPVICTTTKAYNTNRTAITAATATTALKR